jgi:hypothetical protein
MAFDQKTRNLLQRTVSACRTLLDAEFAAQRRSTYGIYDDGTAAPLDSLSHLPDEDMQTARLLRERMDHLVAGLVAQGKKEAEARKEAVGRLTRDQAFTVLNRLAALRMAEEREIVLECVRRGTNSEGFELFLQSAGNAFGDRFSAYRAYLFILFDEMAIDLGVLYDRWDPLGLLFPRQEALEEVLKELNGTGTAATREDITPEAFSAIWAEDETVGWIYQYYNDPTERKKMREESSAPRNSRELAVRNQFFTPRYVVEFLTDNTLGRIWYEMTQGQTSLKDQCRYLVRRPNELFLTAIEPCYRDIYGKDAEVPSDIFDYDAYAALYKGNFKPAADGKDGFIALAAGVLATESIEAVIGEKWDQHGNECLDDLTRAIGQGLPHPRKDDLPWVWAALSQYVANSQIGSPYAKDTTRAFDELFRGLLRQHLDSSSSSQEDLLKQPVFIPHRPLKDPRTILMLDPACGSMHFGLYAFDLFEVVYEEAWALEETLGADALSRPPGMKSLHATYAGKDAFLKDVPRLIIECNIHGVDIDPRAAQIAGLALWLRAQKAWQRLGLAPADRPAIKRSNIVCAEPMPGEKELLREFVEREFPAAERAVCLRLLEAIFDKMQLAGEAGSLLKIEEEIRTAIEDARAAWERLQGNSRELFTEAAPPPASAFWEGVENLLLLALRKYSEQSEAGGGFQRRLFSEDAARGFAFIDLCRKRYDVVLMNPPFGDASKNGKEYIDISYRRSKGNLLANFVEMASVRLTDAGLLGAIVSRTCFFLKTFTEFREEVLGKELDLMAFADLGLGVLDAMVETAAGTWTKASAGRVRAAGSCFVRALALTDKATVLESTITAFGKGNLTPNGFCIQTTQFQRLADSPFVYWIGPDVAGKIAGFSTIDPAACSLRVGLQTGDDERFLRLWSEIPPTQLISGQGTPSAADAERECQKQAGSGKMWAWYSKTDEASPFLASIHMCVKWQNHGAEIKAYHQGNGHSPSKYVMSEDHYFRPGFSYMLRSVRLVPYAVPSGTIPTAGRSQVYPKENLEDWLLILLASNLATAVARFRAENFFGPKFQNSMVGSVPYTPPPADLVADGLEIVRQKRRTLGHKFQADESEIHFVCPPVWSLEIAAPAIDRRCLLNQDLESRIAAAYGLQTEGLQALTADINEAVAGAAGSMDDDGEESADQQTLSAADVFATFVSYALGCICGSWDIRFATGERAIPELPAPFTPLPVFPPGMLLAAGGPPRFERELPDSYPVRIAWDGLMADDPGNTLDIESRVRETFAIIWRDQAAAVEHRSCQDLGVNSLRDYFRKPTGFFADHLKRYSKSRRQAPIYWPLSTASGSYTLWLYYHRLTPDTLYKCLQQFVEPKIKDVEQEIHHLRTMLTADEAGTKERKQLADVETLLNELKDLHAELSLWAPKWKPNLNDGVLITASPLWKLFRLPIWQKKLKTTWMELEKGSYDWAHLALTLWPDRVHERCKNDLSVAIAHGLEELCEVKAPEPKKKQAAKKAAKAAESTSDLL